MSEATLKKTAAQIEAEFQECGQSRLHVRARRGHAEQRHSPRWI